VARLLRLFAVKLPMWPVHTWLPDAHVERDSGSVILAGGLLKVGGYGFLRFSLPMFPLASLGSPPCSRLGHRHLHPLVALAQEDVKKLIYHSWCPHGCHHGHLQLHHAGVDGAIFQMLSPRAGVGALFCAWASSTTARIPADRDLRRARGRVPLYAAVFVVFTLANVGLPGGRFIGEFLTLVGAFRPTRESRSGDIRRDPVAATLCGSGA
jgi:NADH-quinone oxidoreductase subunit M